MTPELLEQRRWERIADYLDEAYDVESVIVPPSEGGGILVIEGGHAFHFFNFKAAVNADVSVADTAESIIEGRRNCFRFDQPVDQVADLVLEELRKKRPNKQ